MRLEMQSESRTLLIAFGGMRGAEIGIPAFEFAAATDGLPVKRLFVRDLRQAWYQRGVPEYGDTLQSVADGLRAFVERHEVDRLVMAGNSAGGYAALAFGTMLGADAVLSFAPQTVLDLDVLAAIGDHRWDAQLVPIVTAGRLDADWMDLGTAIPRARAERTRYEVFVDEQLTVDRLHAERLEAVEGLRLYRFGKGGHGLVRALREAGALQRLLGRALDLDG
jgi:acetyl esterase/lipase